MFKTLLLINLKWLLQSFFSPNSKNAKKKSPAKKKLTRFLIALLAIYIVAYLMVAVCMVFYSFSASFGATDLEWFYFALIGLVVFLFTFIGSVFSTQNIIFNSKDNELLLSMPIPTFYILASRVTLLFVLDLFYALLLAVPSIGVYFYQYGFSLSKLIIYIVSVLMIVVFSAAVTSFFGWLIALISSKMKKGALFQTIFSFLFLGVYMLFFTNLQNYINTLITNGKQISETLRKFMPVFYFFGKGISESDIVSLIILAVCAAVPFALACLLISKSFIKITTTKKFGKKKRYIEKELSVSSARYSLLKKELSRFFSLPILILNCGMGCLMAFIFAVFILIKGEEMLTAFAIQEAFGFENIMPVILCIVLAFCSGMCNSTAASISLEGGKINVIRSMPISSSDFYYAKYVSNLIIGLPPLLIAVILSSLGLKLSLEDVVAVTAASIAFFAVSNFINMFCNTLLPRFSWSSEAVIVKQAPSVIAGMLSIMGACALFFSPYFVLSKYLSSSAYLLIISAICVIICLLFVKYFKTGGKKRFENMYC